MTSHAKSGSAAPSPSALANAFRTTGAAQAVDVVNAPSGGLARSRAETPAAIAIRLVLVLCPITAVGWEARIASVFVEVRTCAAARSAVGSALGATTAVAPDVTSRAVSPTAVDVRLVAIPETVITADARAEVANGRLAVSRNSTGFSPPAPCADSSAAVGRSGRDVWPAAWASRLVRTATSRVAPIIQQRSWRATCARRTFAPSDRIAAGSPATPTGKRSCWWESVRGVGSDVCAAPGASPWRAR